MECECLLEPGALGRNRDPQEPLCLLMVSSLSPHLSLQQEQWMNVRVGDIIKLENNQFVAVRD